MKFEYELAPEPVEDKMPPGMPTIEGRLANAEQAIVWLRDKVWNLEQLGPQMPNTTNEQRLAIVEREIATLRQRVSALEHPGMPG